MPTDISELKVKKSDPETSPKLWVKFAGCLVLSISFIMLWLAILKGFHLVKTTEFMFCLVAGISLCLGESLQETYGESIGDFAQKQIRKFRKEEGIDEMHAKLPTEQAHEVNKNSNKLRQFWLSFTGRIFLTSIVYSTGFFIVTAFKLPFPSEPAFYIVSLLFYTIAMATIGTFGVHAGKSMFSKNRVGG